MEWKLIVSYPNYSISNFGNVKNNKTQKIIICEFKYLKNILMTTILEKKHGR